MDQALLGNGDGVIIDSSLPIDSPFFSLEDHILKLHSVETLEKCLEDLQFQIAYKICGHISLDDKKGIVVCSNKAGGGTGHENTGRCYQHDKLSYKARSPYTRHLKQFETLQEIFETFENREKKLNDLSEEISIGRMALAHQLSLLEKGKFGKNDMLFKNIILALEMIRKIAESIAKIQQAESSGITTQSITSFLYQVSEILNQEIVDKNSLTRILDRVATECSFLSV
jgi:hypothetical protein